MTTNVHVDGVSDSAEVTEQTGNDANASDSQVALTFGALKGIESKANVNAQAEGGYKAEVASVDGNTAFVTVYEEADTGGALATVAAGTEVTVSGNAEGY